MKEKRKSFGKGFKGFVSLMMATALIGAAVLGITGCGKDGEKAYIVGATGPLTGENSSYGISVNQGATLAFEEINAAGGLNGVKFEFVMKDDKSTAADAASAYDQLFDAGMQVSLGSVTSGSCEAFAARAESDNLFFITPSASAASVIEKGKNAFRVCFGDPDQGILAAEELTSKYTKIGCIYDTSDTYSTGIWEAFDGKMKELNVAYSTRTFDSDNKKDFSAEVEALKDCEVIFLPIYYTEAGLIARACEAKELTNIALFGCDGLDGVAGQIDASVTNSIRYITPFDVNATDEKTQKFVSSYEAKYGTKPDQFAADGYDAAYVVFEAMKAAGINDVNIKPGELCDKLIAAITDASFSYAGVTGDMTWDATGACTKTPVIVDLNQ